MIPRRATDWSRSARKALRLRGKRDEARHQGNAYMFVDDVRIWIMPIRLGRGGQRFKARLEPASAEWEAALADALSHKSYSDSLSDACCDFFQDLAVQLASCGRSLYEIIRAPEHNERGPWPFRLSWFSDEGVRRRGELYVQEGEALSVETAGYEHAKVEIPAGDVWEVRLPDSIGSWREQGRLLELLGQLNPYPPEWLRREWAANTNQSGYEFAHHKRETDVLLAQVSGAWKWDARMTWKDNVLEYYEVYRMLMFRTALARLREHMLLRMNELLRRLGCGSVLVFEGIPTSAELVLIARELHDGRVSYETVLKSSTTSPSRT